MNTWSAVDPAALWRKQVTFLLGLATGRMGHTSPLPDPAILQAHARRPGPVQGGLALPHWPPMEDDQAEHQLRLKPTRERDLELTCTCQASIETRTVWADSQARIVWAAWHAERGLL